jgi:hypothetical protein
MTDTELTLISHPAIQGRRGEWQVGDCGYFRGNVFYVTGGTTKQEFYRVNRDKLAEEFMAEMLWLPLPIDPINPERGLWGMVAEHATYVKVLDTKDQVSVEVRRGVSISVFYGKTLTEALLRAIIAQEDSK